MSLDHRDQLAAMIHAAKGDTVIDTLFVNGKIVNVLSGEIYEGSVGVHNGMIVGIGDYNAKEVIDLRGRHLAPGLMDGHMHLESTMLDPAQFARAVVPRGTTTVVVDPHEMANVKGIEGIKYLLRFNPLIPLDFYAMVPSCVPATHMETSGVTLTAEEMRPSFDKDRILGLAEMMDFPGVLSCDPEVLEKLRAAGHKRIDGHSPGLVGKDLNAYLVAGPRSDHECTTFAEAQEKLRKGMYIMIREGSVSRDLSALLPLVTHHNMHRCMLVTDDRDPIDLMETGHINDLLVKAVAKGMDPIMALTMATINPAEYFGFRDLGAVAPGYQADLVVFEDLSSFKALQVYKRGILVARDGVALFEAARPKGGDVFNTVHVGPVKPESLNVKATGDHINVIGIIPMSLLTTRSYEPARIVNGCVESDPDRDILKMAVFERHHATGNVGVGFVKGFGLQRGALASTVAHDSHNLIVVGVTDEDILAAVKAIEEIQGGLAVVAGGQTLGTLSLPICGLITSEPLDVVKGQLEHLTTLAEGLGCTADHPFMTLSFLALPVIPDLKLTDKGLVDVVAFKLISNFDPPALVPAGIA